MQINQNNLLKAIKLLVFTKIYKIKGSFIMGLISSFKNKNKKTGSRVTIISVLGTSWKAKCFDNNVMCVPDNSSEFQIGYYQRTSDNTYDVYSDKGYLIGQITDTGSSALVHFSRLGMLKKFEDLGFPKQIPNSLTNLFAESFPNIILDKATNSVCASYFKGNDYIAAGAAFVCMHYEVISDSIYHSYFLI